MIARTYAEITREVDGLIRRRTGGDRRRTAYMVARAALLIVKCDMGRDAAAEVAYQLADELAVER